MSDPTSDQLPPPAEGTEPANPFGWPLNEPFDPGNGYHQGIAANLPAAPTPDGPVA